MKKYMTACEVKATLGNIQDEHRDAKNAHSWGDGHRAQWYTELRPLIKLLTAWYDTEFAGIGSDCWDGLVELVPEARPAFAAARATQNENEAFNLKAEILTCAQGEFDRLACKARQVARSLALEVARDEWVSIPERLSEEAARCERPDSVVEQLAGMGPEAAAEFAREYGIAIEDHEGTRGICTYTDAVGWAIVRSWEHDGSEIVEYEAGE